ncbi:hypothetical protein AN958_12731 [Leucoagaricus sp. SymC.cos]|nr:hypothetical protein AN958_12731 [Leucoagaricus sp. SymC.cos]
MAFFSALDWFADRYHIRHIRISAYNSQSNGVIETTHRTMRDGLVKMCAGYIKNWYEYAPHIFWADRVTTRKSTGMTPPTVQSTVSNPYIPSTSPRPPFSHYPSLPTSWTLSSLLLALACFKNATKTWSDP